MAFIIWYAGLIGKRQEPIINIPKNSYFVAFGFAEHAVDLPAIWHTGIVLVKTNLKRFVAD